MSSSIAAPAFFGLNTQESGVTLQEGFALQADNCIIDKYGRLGSRKGWQTLSTSKDSSAGANVGVNLKGLSNFKDLDGTDIVLSFSSDKFYRDTTDLVTLTPSASNNCGAMLPATPLPQSITIFSSFSILISDLIVSI